MLPEFYNIFYTVEASSSESLNICFPATQLHMLEMCVIWLCYGICPGGLEALPRQSNL